MPNSDGFFGGIFDSAEDDPLLQSEPDAYTSGTNDGAHAESDATPEPQPETTSDASPSPTTDAAEIQEVVLQQTGSSTRGLEDLNEAVENGWRVSHISLDDKIRSASGDVDTEISILMERETPRSLFDFGGTY